MAKSKKPHRRPGPGKPQGATYAQMLAHKAAVRKGLEQAARDIPAESLDCIKQAADNIRAYLDGAPIHVVNP